MCKKLLIQLVFWLHLPIVLVWFGLFFVPQSLWSGVVDFHFWYIVVIMIVQLLWGLTFYPVIKKVDIICPVTTLMQWMRGYPRSSVKNYGHSFIAEFCGMLGFKVHYAGVNVALLVTLGLIVVRYFVWSW
jgi:hypothetical protein